MLLLYLVFFFSLFHAEGSWGFTPEAELELGPIKKIRISLSPEAMLELYPTVKADDYAPCTYEERGRKIEARIRVRGFTSRLHAKKSFTVKMKLNGESLKYSIEGNSVQNRIAFFTYNLAGLRVPDTEGAALFINGEYLGCYTKIKLYDQDTLKNDYYGISGQLFKCYFPKMGYDQPLSGRSEKKFPDDNDFSRLERLIYNVTYMDNEEWSRWLEANADRDLIARYMIVHDFLAVKDTSLTNFCVYDYGKFSCFHGIME